MIFLTVVKYDDETANTFAHYLEQRNLYSEFIYVTLYEESLPLHCYGLHDPL